MLDDVRHGCLCDSVHRGLDIWNERVLRAADLELEREIVWRGNFRHPLSQELCEVAASKRWRPHVPHRFARISDRRLRYGHQIAEHSPAFGRHFFAPLCGDELQRHARETLEQGIVDLTRQARPPGAFSLKAAPPYPTSGATLGATQFFRCQPLALA